MITWVARSTRSSSPSVKTMRRGDCLAAVKIGFMIRPDWYTNSLSFWTYAGKSLIGSVATPLSIAAWATAGAIFTMRRGSNGRGMRYSGPKLTCCEP
jgi:hypothetical protein